MMLRNGTKHSALHSQRLSLQAFTNWLEASQFQHRESLSAATPGDQRFASTSHRSRPVAEPESRPLPRFLRRQALHQSGSKVGFQRWTGKEKAAETSTSKAAPAFRSKHYDPSREPTPREEIRFLEPHILSSRLQKLSDNGKVDDAIFMLKNAPLDAQNTQVWNTMIWETMKEQRYSLAYQLFTDMKRRGFSPSLRTYQTMLNGLARIKDWSLYTKQLSNAESLYDGYKGLVDSIKRGDPNDPQLSADPLASYIRILGKAGEYQRIFDVFYAMDKDGPLAANRLVYTAMFQAIHSALGDTTEGRVKVAADARLLWNQLIRSSKKNTSLTPDSYTIVSAITALSGGNEVDHELAFKIVAEYFGLTAGESTSKPGTLPLSGESFIAILRLCNMSKQYALCAKFSQQVRRRPEDMGGASLLDRGHMEEILRADIALNEPGLGNHAVQTLEWMLRQEITGTNGPKIRPALSTYNLVVQACWFSADWNGAKRAFELMTGYHTHDFSDGAHVETPRLDKRGSGRRLDPNAELMSLMVRTATATRSKADLRQVLRLVDYLGYEKILAARGDMNQETMRVAKRRGFINEKFSEAVLEAVQLLLAEKGEHVRSHELAKFKLLEKLARGENGPAASTGSSSGQRTKSAKRTSKLQRQ